jgi:hypothetical protein
MPEPAPPVRSNALSLRAVAFFSLYAVVFFCLLAVVIGNIIYRSATLRPVCDTFEAGRACRPCPRDARCIRGRVFCADGFLHVQNLCIEEGNQFLIDAVDSVIAAAQLRAGSYVCGLAKRDSLTYSEMESLVLPDTDGSDRANEIFMETLLETLSLNSSGIEARTFGQSRLFVSKEIRRPFTCVVKSSVKYSLLVVLVVTALAAVRWSRSQNADWWTWRRVLTWLLATEF